MSQCSPGFSCLLQYAHLRYYPKQGKTSLLLEHLSFYYVLGYFLDDWTILSNKTLNLFLICFNSERWTINYCKLCQIVIKSCRKRTARVGRGLSERCTNKVIYMLGEKWRSENSKMCDNWKRNALDKEQQLQNTKGRTC